MESLIAIVGSKGRAEIFRLLFEDPNTELYLREIHRRSGLSLGAIQQEVDHLLSADLILARRDGNRVYYRANISHPLYPELHRLVEKTTGVEALLGRALKDPEIELAFIFGSVAAGNAKPDSDLDLFVVGNLGLRKLTKLLSGVSTQVGRVINPQVQTPEEFKRKVRKEDHFVSTILAGKKIFVVGDEDDLKRLG